MPAMLPNDTWHGIKFSDGGFIIQHPNDCNFRRCAVLSWVEAYADVKGIVEKCNSRMLE